MMSDTTVSITVNEFWSFYAKDRTIYSVLVNEFSRDPIGSIQIMGLWLWLERHGYRDMVSKIVCLPHVLVNEIADEAVTCLSFVHDAKFVLLPERNEIPLTQSLVKGEISLQFFHQNQDKAIKGIKKVVREVYLKAFKDITDAALQRNAAASALVHSQMFDQSFVQNHAHLGFVGESCDSINEVPREERTMFATFSKGYPVSELEVRESFASSFGDCIESFKMQDVDQDEQALYARIVFKSPVIIEYILNGMVKAKFTIKGKHVWMRKFVPKHAIANATVTPVQPNLPEAN